MFIDEVEIHVRAGDGGNGCVSFRREKYVPRGGPDGGEGGRGGSVIIKSDKNIKTLIDFYYHPHYKAGRGEHGQGDNRSGKSGKDVIVSAPLGTVVYDAKTGDLLSDLIENGQEFLLAKGGRGGKGNAHFATSTNQAPRFAQKGEQGEEYHIRLELKFIADIGIVGMPNAGKSTLLGKISKARPKIANYPFTTLYPNLGVVDLGDGFSFVVADMPGLIEGAASGKGLGDRFLRHVQRAKILVHLIDLSDEEEGRNFQSDYETIVRELELYGPSLLVKKHIVVGNKIDMPRAKRVLPEAQRYFKKKKMQFLAISGISGDGLKKLVKVLAGALLCIVPFLFVFELSVSAISKGPFSSKEERNQFLSRRVYELQEKKNLNKPLRVDKQFVSGTKKFLVILIKAKDVAGTYDSTKFQDLLFSKGTYSTGSLRDYFAEVSNNKFDVYGDVFGFYTASQNYSYYVDEQSGLGKYPKNMARLAEEAIGAADSAGVDFAQFDNDGDGEVEGVWIVHQGAGAEAVPSSEEDYHIWSHKWDIASGGGTARTCDGVRINNYIVQPETNTNGDLIEIGVFCHEFGHLLGLPELYDTDYSSCGNGVYDLMSGGEWGSVDKKHPESPAHLSAWSKYYLGWANVYDWTAVEDGRTLAQVETGNEIVKIDVEGSSKEYFLLCNRRKTGFDKYLPGEGLLIWHVDENRIDANMKRGRLNDNESAQSISLMEADGQFNLREGLDSGGNDGDAGDYFPGTTGNTSFTSTSNPSSNKNNGERSGVSIRYIDSPSLVTFSLGSAGPSVAGVGETFCYPNPFKLSGSTKQTIIKYPDNLAVSLEIYNIAGEIVRTLEREGTDLLASKGEAYWDGKNDDGVLVSAGLYIYLIDSPQGKSRGKILFVK